MLAPILARSANVSRAAKEKAALAGDNSDFVPILVPRAGVEPTTLSLGRICSSS